MTDKILRQVALAALPDGTIGNEDKLLFTCPTDLANFVEFTKHTVVIAGRLSAKEMLLAGFKPSAKRPLLVISESGSISPIIKSDQIAKFIFYAVSLDKALKMAVNLSAAYDLNGYTVCGGKTVYDAFFDLLDAGKTILNRAYIFSTEFDESSAITSPVKLSRDLAQIRAIIKNRMGYSKRSVVNVDTSLKLPSGDSVRGKNGSFEWTYDRDEIDCNAVRPNSPADGRIKLYLSTGEVVIDATSISNWTNHTHTNSVTIHLHNGHSIEARFATLPGLEWLKKVLNALA